MILGKRMFLHRVGSVNYYVPLDKEERFNYLMNKINTISFSETVRGYRKVLSEEFREYRVNLVRWSLWRNSEGDLVKIVSIRNNFIRYRLVRKFWLWYIGYGYVLSLNEESFLRIFREEVL